MRKEARILTSVWQNSDFTELPLAAQGLYWMLLSQSDITLAGVLPYMPGRWARLSNDTVEATEAHLSMLEDRRFVVVDRETMEVCLRSFVRHDGATRTIKVRRGLWSAWSAILSPTIRELVLDQLDDEHIEEAHTEGWITGRGRCGYSGLDHRRKHLLAERDGGWICAYCTEPVRPECEPHWEGLRAEVDHVNPRAAGGKDVLANMVLSCQPCNNKKGDRPLSDFQRELEDRGIQKTEIGVSPSGPSRARPPSSVSRPPSSTSIGAAEAPQEKANGKPPSKDELFEVVAEVCGIDWQAGLTKSERGEINNAVKQLRDDVSATPDQVRAKARSYRRKWDRADLTPSALVKHWSKVDGRPVETSQAVPAAYDPDDAEARFRALTGGPS